MDVFTQNLWGFREELELVNRQPFVPSLVSRLFNWVERGLRTKVAFIQNIDGVVSLIPSSPRGSAPIQHRPTGRTARPVQIPHFSIADHINADEILGVTSWTNPASLKTIEEERAMRVADITPKLDLTVEHLRLGALKGLVLDVDGTTLADIYDLTGQSQASEVNMTLGSATAGAVYQKIVDLKRQVKRALKADAEQMTGLVILADATFVDNFRKSKDYVDRHLIGVQDLAMKLNEITDVISWLGVSVIEYEPGDFGPGGTNKFLGTGKGLAIPTGPSLNIFRTFYAPADYIDTVNQIAQPRYLRSFTDPKGKFIEMEFQTNPLPFVTRPEALIRVDDGV